MGPAVSKFSGNKDTKGIASANFTADDFKALLRLSRLKREDCRRKSVDWAFRTWNPWRASPLTTGPCGKIRIQQLHHTTYRPAGSTFSWPVSRRVRPRLQLHLQQRQTWLKMAPKRHRQCQSKRLDQCKVSAVLMDSSERFLLGQGRSENI